MTGHRDARRCTECGKPVLVAIGTRHMSCSPICTTCHAPIPSTDANPAGPTHAAAACTRTRKTPR